MKKELLRLFNAIQVENRNELDSKDFIKYIKHGVLIHPSIPLTKANLDAIEDVIGITGEKANATFHKSWDKVVNASIEQLVIEQMIHYMTTYGFEKMGIYSENTVYIPNEELNVPELTEDIPMTFINALTKEDVLERVKNLGSGIALAKSTLDDMMVVIEGNKYDNSFVDSIGNRELKSRLFIHFDMAPKEPVEFLRYAINKLTGDSLVIKNKYLIEKIKESSAETIDELIEKAPRNLGSIFLRYKPLFLAMKSASTNKTFFNNLRKQAKTMHKPLPMDYLNNVTAMIKDNTLDIGVLSKKLENANIYRKIRLGNSLKYRLNATNAIVHTVRNGKGFVREFNWEKNVNANTERALNVVLESIANDMKENVSEKVFYIPDYVNYTIPATEKQFVGNFPSGSYVEVPEDMIFGINWKNQHDRRVDLDLSLISAEGKTGWDGSYRTDSLVFSGDITDACGANGASESYYVKKNLSGANLIRVNDFTSIASPDTPIDCKLFVGSEKVENRFSRDYTIDPNNIFAYANIPLDKKDNTIGLVVNVEGMNRLYFTQVSTGNKITSSCDDKATMARDYFSKSCQEMLSLKRVLTLAGAKVVNVKPEDKDVEFVDFSPENMSKDSILSLMVNKKV